MAFCSASDVITVRKINITFRGGGGVAWMLPPLDFTHSALGYKCYPPPPPPPHPPNTHTRSSTPSTPSKKLKLKKDSKTPATTKKPKPQQPPQIRHCI